VGTKVIGKTYPFKVVQIVNARTGTDCNSLATEDHSLPGTITWITPTFSDGATSFSFDASYIARVASASPGYVSVGVNSNIEDPCDINLEVTVADP